MDEANIVYDLQRRLRDLHMQITSLQMSNKGHLEQIDDNTNAIRRLKVVYTSLLNTALAYEDFDREDFESGL